MRQTIGVALVVERNHFIAQNTVQILAVASVVNIPIRMSPASANGETGAALYGIPSFQQMAHFVEKVMLRGRRCRFLSPHCEPEICNAASRDALSRGQ